MFLSVCVVTGFVCNVSLELFQFNHLTSLFLNDNQLKVLPPDVCRLTNLNCLDVSSNQLRSLPMELGDLIELKELILKYNQLTSLPFELGKLFQLYLIGRSERLCAVAVVELYPQFR